MGRRGWVRKQTSQVGKRTGRAVRTAGIPAPAKTHWGQSNSKYCGKRRGNFSPNLRSFSSRENPTCFSVSIIFQRCKKFCMQWIWLNFHFKFDKSVRELGFPGGARGNEPACQCRRHKRCAFDPWVGKILWNGAWQPTPVFLPGESHGQKSLVGYSPGGCKESDTTEAT